MIYLVLFFGLILRLINLNQSLWWDEGITFTAVSKYNLLDLVTKFPLGDFHPPLYYALLMYWTKIFGYSEVAMRAPSVMFGVILIWVVYLIGKKLFTLQIGLTAGLLTATSPLLVYYSQEARMYSLDALLVCISMYFFILLINSNFKNTYLTAAFLFTNILLLYSDYIIYLVFPAQFLFILFYKRDLVLRYLFLCVLIFIFFIPWIPILVIQMENGARVRETLPVWSHIVGGASFKEVGLLLSKTIFGRISFDDKRIYLSLAILGGACYGFLVMLNIKNKNTYSRMFLIWFMLPIILALGISWFTPIFSYFRMIFILPALYLLLSIGIQSFSKKIAIVLIFLIFLANLGFLYIYYVNPSFQREDWRGAVRYAQNYNQGKSVIVFESNTVPDVVTYYDLDKGKTSPVAGADTVMQFEYLVDITDPDRLLEKQLGRTGFKKVGTKDFNGVGFINIFQR